MKSRLFVLLLAVPTTNALAQSLAIFPDEYVAVAEGPFNSPNYPLAYGLSRVQVLYDRTDIAITNGSSITKLGFRQDATLTTMDAGRTLQLEVRMGYSNNTPASMVTNFDNNYAAPPTTVFGPATFVLPNLRDSNNPLPNGRFFLTLTTPFVYAPAPGQNLVVEYRIFGTSSGNAAFNYRLDRADYYSPRTYGPAGCPHSGGGTPNMTLAGTRPGLAFSASVNAAPTSAPGAIALVTGYGMVTPYPLTGLLGTSPACTGQVDIALAGVFSMSSNTSGNSTWSFTIPNNPTLADFVISAQTAWLDFFSPGGVVVSNGGQVLTGAAPRTAIVAASGNPTVVITGTKSNNYCPVAFFEHQ